MWWWILAVAWAQPVTLQSEYLTSERAARAFHDVAQQHGAEGEVVRTYLAGEGWRWTYRSVPLDEQDAADLQQRMTATGLALVVVGEPPVSGGLGAEQPEDLTVQVARAHMGPDAIAWDPDGPVSFAFTRVLDDGRVVDHLYERRGDDRYVEVREGDVVLVQATVQGSRAWSTATRDDALAVERVRTQADRFSPEAVLGVPMRLAGGRPPADERRRLSSDPSASTLTYGGSASSYPSEIAVDPQTHLASSLRVVLPGGVEVTWFDGWTRTGVGNAYPTVVRREVAGRVVDHVEVQALRPDFSSVLRTPGPFVQ